MADDGVEDGRRSARGVSRRVFLGGLGTVAPAAVVSACTNDEPTTQSRPPPGSAQVVPEGAAPRGAARDALQFLNPQQARTLDAIVSRLVPGDEENPGASEAGAVYYIDHLLASHTGYSQPAYMKGPFARTYDGDRPPDEEGDVVWVAADQLERYGRQSPFVPREIYRMGLARLDALSRQRFDSNFVDVDSSRQDELLAAVEDDEDDDVAQAFADMSAGYFFQVVRQHTLEGFLADPVYGGNRDMVGWRLVGFPGSRRSYSPQDMFDESYDVTPQSLLDMPTFNADHHDVDDPAGMAVRQRHPLGPID